MHILNTCVSVHYCFVLMCLLNLLRLLRLPHAELSGPMDQNTRLTLDGLVNSIRCALGKLTDFLVLERGEKGQR